MKRSILVIAMLVTINLATSAYLYAEERIEKRYVGEITSVDRTVLSVLNRENCDPNWLSQAMRDSDINPAYAARLPLGKRIYLRAVSCRLPAPGTVRQSRSYYTAAAPRTPTTSRTPRTRKTAAKKVVVQSAVIQKPEPVKTENLIVKVEPTIERVPVTAPQPAPATQSTVVIGVTKRDRNSIILALVIGMILGAGIALALQASRNRKVMTYQKVYTTRSGGVVFPFDIVGPPSRRCRHCLTLIPTGVITDMEDHARICPHQQNGRVTSP